MASIKPLNSAINSIFPRKYNESILKKFYTYEYSYLIGSSSLNPLKLPKNSSISIAQVENYFPFPLILTRCIWKAFSYKKNEYTIHCNLSLDDYVNGFLTIYTGSVEARIRMVFHLFNVNNDKFVHIEDVKCILNYIHIYCNKKQISLLNDTITDFFGKHKIIDEENFVTRTIKKNSGLFLIMMSIFSELKTFSHEMLAFMGDNSCGNLGMTVQSPSVKNNVLMKKIQSKFKIKENFNLYNKESGVINSSQDTNFFPKFYTNIGISFPKKDDDKVLSPDAIVDYIQTNYNPEFTFNHSLKNVNQNINNNNNENLDETFDSSYSNANQMTNCRHALTTTFNSNEEVTGNSALDLRDMLELEMFENDLKYLRFAALDGADKYNYQIPKGSNDFILKSGVVEFLGTSNMSNKSRGSIGSGLNRSFNLSMIGGDISGLNGQAGRQNSPGKSSFVRSNTGKFPQSVKKGDNGTNGIPGSPFRERGDANNSSFVSEQSSLLLNVPEVYEEEVSLMTKDNKLKKYTLFLVKGFLIFAKKKNIDLINLNDKDLMTPEIKKIIPLKRLFVIETNNNILIGDKNYNILNLGSTIQYIKRQYTLHFETKAPLVTLVSLILSETEYISVSKEYTYIKDIGRGSFCHMKLMRHNKSSKLYAVKQMNKSPNSLDEFNTQNWEKDIITFLINYNKCEHLLKFYNIFETYGHLYITSEYIETGSLSKYLSKIKERLLPSVVNKIALHISRGLKELHNYGIIHRDLKLENIVMSVTDKGDFTAKLIDFGLSKVITPLARTKEPYGTLIYCSPEIMLGVPYNAKVDVWSLGIITFYLLFALMPFDVKGNENDREISHKIIVNSLKFPTLPSDLSVGKEMKVSKGLIDVISRSLYKDIESRCSIADVENKLTLLSIET